MSDFDKLIEASKTGTVDEVKRLINSGIDISQSVVRSAGGGALLDFDNSCEFSSTSRLKRIFKA